MIHNHYKNPILFKNMPSHYLSSFFLETKLPKSKYGLSFSIRQRMNNSHSLTPAAVMNQNVPGIDYWTETSKYTNPEPVLETAQKPHKRYRWKKNSLVFSTKQEVKCCHFNFYHTLLQTIMTYLCTNKWRAAISRLGFTAIIEPEHFKAITTVTMILPTSVLTLHQCLRLKPAQVATSALQTLRKLQFLLLRAHSVKPS